MTEIYFSKEGRLLKFRCSGHCSHDVCLGVSALCNALVNYAEIWQQSKKALVSEEYERGYVRLELYFDKLRRRDEFLREVSALVEGFEMISEEEPYDVRLKIGADGWLPDRKRKAIIKS